MIMLGSLHGLVFLPVLLSFIGEDCTEKNVLWIMFYIRSIFSCDDKEYEPVSCDPSKVSSFNNHRLTDDTSAELRRSATEE